MVVETRVFGTIEVQDEKIISFPQGIVGFPDLKRFTLIFDVEKGDASGIKWLQSIDEPAFAMPVVDPLLVCCNYNPAVEDALLAPLGNLKQEDMLILVTVSVPKEIKEMSVNLQAPIVINADNCRACQIVVDSAEYPVKYKIYDILQKIKEKAGE